MYVGLFLFLKKNRFWYCGNLSFRKIKNIQFWQKNLSVVFAFYVFIFGFHGPFHAWLPKPDWVTELEDFGRVDFRFDLSSVPYVEDVCRVNMRPTVSFVYWTVSGISSVSVALIVRDCCLINKYDGGWKSTQKGKFSVFRHSCYNEVTLANAILP